MAPLPKTALRQSKLINLTAGSAVPKSGHQVIQVEFVDFDGQKKKAFFKPLDETYPEILAKISVATSVIMRTSIGARAAEDRLVYDDEGKISGTLSIALNDFKPFNYGSEAAPDDPQKKEETTPSCETLMQHNVIELLFFSWFLGDDDLHPKNIGLKGRIDWDMFFYAITEIIKGPREVGGSAGGKLELSTNDFANFPVLNDSKCTHWPTRQVPGNFYYPKRYSNYAQFIALAKNPTYDDTAENKKTTAQEQLFTAALKALLTYQPKILKKRLKDAIGKEPLNYTALTSKQQYELESKFPSLFNTESNKSPFIKFMLQLYQNHYDELYRKVVFYQGCEKNDSGVPVPAFHQFLSHHPSAYNNLKVWVKAQNEKMAEQQNLAQNFRKEDSANESACVGPQSKAVGATSDNRKLNEDELLRRYHLIWRDSYSLSIQDILYKARELSDELQSALSLPDELQSALPLKNHHSITKKTPHDHNITQAWELLSTLNEDNIEAVEGRLDCDKDNDLRKGLINIIELNQRFYKTTETYFNKNIDEITPLDNNQFLESLRQLTTEYIQTIPDFGDGTSWGKSCATIASSLSDFCNTANFYIHLYQDDKTAQPLVPIRTITSKHTDENIVNNCLDALFNWATKLRPDELEQKINKIIDSEYSNALSVNRNRNIPVKAYLQESSKISGEDRLAFILSSGDKQAGALNTLLIKNLIQEMTKSTQADIQVYLPSVTKAFEDQEFNAEFYTLRAVDYAKTNVRFNHLYSKNAFEQINRTIYNWINSISLSQLRGYTYSALTSYESKISYFTRIATGGRRQEVDGYFSNHDLSNGQILSLIFSKGGTEDSSLNTYFFEKILNAMKKDIVADNPKLPKENYKFIIQITEQNQSYFLPLLQNHAKEITQGNIPYPSVSEQQRLSPA